jgi:hypothetical protein
MCSSVYRRKGVVAWDNRSWEGVASATLSGRGRMHEQTGMGRELLASYQGGNVFVGVGVSAWCNRCEWERVGRKWLETTGREDFLMQMNITYKDRL